MISEMNNEAGENETLETARPHGFSSLIARFPLDVPAFGFYALLSAFLTWPVIMKLSTSLYGFPSDNQGTIWQWWWIRNAASFGAKASFSPLVGYPFGTSVNTVPQEAVTELTARFLMIFMNEVATFNLMIISSFLLSGITMYYLVRHLTGSRGIAFFGGLVYLALPYHAYHSMVSISLAMTQWIPLFILALLLFIERPRVRSAVFLLVASILVVGSSVHYGFFLVIFTPAFLLGQFLYKRLYCRSRRNAEGPAPALSINWRTAGLAAAVIILIVLFTVPTYYHQRFFGKNGEPPEWPTRETYGSSRTLESTYHGAALPQDYLVPFKLNPLLGGLGTRLRKTGDVAFQNSLYLGWVVILLAVLAFILICRRSRPRKPSEDNGEGTPAGSAGIAPLAAEEHNDVLPFESRAALWGFVAAGITGFVMSMPPYLNIGSTRVPLPSMIARFMFPEFRWYMRVGVLVALSCIILACFGLQWLISRRNLRIQVAMVAVASLLVLLEMVAVPPFRYFEFEKVPELYTEISGLSDESGLVFYPAFESGYFDSQSYLFRQRWFRKPMLNGAPDGSQGEALRRTVYNPFNPETPAILSRFNIQHAIYYDRMFKLAGGTKFEGVEVQDLPEGFEIIKHVEDENASDDAYILLVTAERAKLVPIYMGDITTPRFDMGLETARLLQSEGIIRVENYSGESVQADILIPVSNLLVEHRLSILNGDALLWEGDLTGDESMEIKLADITVPSEGLTLVLRVAGQQVEIPSDEYRVFNTRTASMRLGDVQTTLR